MPRTGDQEQRAANARLAERLRDEVSYLMSIQDWLNALDLCRRAVILCEDWDDLQHELLQLYSWLFMCCMANGLVDDANRAQARIDELHRQQ